MALIDTVDPTDVNIALQDGIGAQLQSQVPAAELENRLDAAAYAAAAILNAPLCEDDLNGEERASAEHAYAHSPPPSDSTNKARNRPPAMCSLDPDIDYGHPHGARGYGATLAE